MDTLWLMLYAIVLVLPSVAIVIFIERSAYWQSQAPLRHFFLGMEERWLDNLVYAVVSALYACAWYVAAGMMFSFTGYNDPRANKVEMIILLCALGTAGGVSNRLLIFCNNRRIEVSSHIRPRPDLPSNPANLSSWITDTPYTLALLVSVILVAGSATFVTVMKPYLLWAYLLPLLLLLFSAYVLCVIGQGYRDFVLQHGLQDPADKP